MAILYEELLPVFDDSDEAALLVNADVATTWRALLDRDLLEVGKTHRLVGVLGAVRMLPELALGLAHGDLPDEMPESMRLGKARRARRHRDRLRASRKVLEAGDRVPIRCGRRLRHVQRVRNRQDGLRVQAHTGRRRHAAHYGHAHRDHRRARTKVVSPLLNLRRRVGRTHPRRRRARQRTRCRRSRSYAVLTSRGRAANISGTISKDNAPPISASVAYPVDAITNPLPNPPAAPES